MFRIETLPVVCNRDPPIASLQHRLYTDIERFSTAMLKGIPDEVLEDHHHLCTVHAYFRKLSERDSCRVVIDIVLRVS